MGSRLTTHFNLKSYDIDGWDLIIMVDRIKNRQKNNSIYGLQFNNSLNEILVPTDYLNYISPGV